MPIRYGNVWKDETVNALLRLKTQKMSYENKASYKKFCAAFDPECKLVRETAIQPNIDKLKLMDPETLKEVNEFLAKDCDLKPLPFDFREIVEKSDMSISDEEHLFPLIAEKVHLAVVE